MTEQSTAMVPLPQGGQAAILDGTPDEQIERAASMARSLQRVVEQAGLSRSFGGKKKYLEYEAWLTLGRFFGCSPVTEWTRPIERDGKIAGYECRVNVVDAQGRVVGGAEGCCMSDEPNWRAKPEFAIKSMVQTRTAGKALRSVFGFVAVLAGYSGTPAEEMQRSWDQGPPQAHRPPQANQRPQPGQAQAQAMSESQKRKLWAMCQSSGLDRGDAKAFVDSLRIQTVRDASLAIEHFQERLDAWREPEPAPVEGELVPDDDVPF
jgi:hypothetical protein